MKRSLLFFALSLLLAGCVSAPLPKNAYYQLAVVGVDRSALSNTAQTIQVGRFSGEGFAAGQALLFRDPQHPGQIQRYSFRFWADMPPAMIEGLMTAALREAGVVDTVLAAGNSARSDWTVSGSLLQLEEQLNPQVPRVAVALELGVVASECRKALFFRTYRQTEPIEHALDQQNLDGLEIARDRRVDRAVVAYNRAITRLVNNFVADLAQALEQSKIERLCRN